MSLAFETATVLLRDAPLLRSGLLRPSGRVLFALAASLLAFAAAAYAQPSAYVANLGSNDVSVIDTVTDTVTATIPVGEDPDGVAVTPDGLRVYVTNFLSDDVFVIDTQTNTVEATIPVGSGPVGIAVTDDGAFAYVTNRGADSVSIIETATNAVVSTVKVGAGPNAVAITPDGASAYVTNSFTRKPGVVSVIDTAAREVDATVAVRRNPNRIAVRPDGRTVYATNFRSWNVTLIDTATNTVTTAIRVAGRPSGIAANPNGAYVYVVTLAGLVHVIDTATNRVVNILDVESQPYGMGILPNGAIGYVANFRSDSVSVIDLIDEIAVASIPVGERPFAVAVNCVGSGCTDPPFTARPRPTRTPTPPATPTGTMTPTRTRTATVFGTAPATSTRTLTPPPGTPPAIEVGRASGRPGERVTVAVFLRTEGRDIVGTQNDIAFDPLARIAARADGEPDCEVNPEIDKAATVFAFLPGPWVGDEYTGGCSGDDCTGVRAIVLAFDNFDPIPDGALLYTCEVNIAPDAAPGTYHLEVRDPGASDPEGMPIAIIGIDGAIVVGALTRAAAEGTSVGGAFLCAGGEKDGLDCRNAWDCPGGGACVAAQGVCDGSVDDGLLCDCPGGTCTTQVVCPSDPEKGTCRGGPAHGRCCHLDLNCAGGSDCVGTQKLCDGGAGKGLPCLHGGQCLDSECRSLGTSCQGGRFEGYSCVDDGDCPLGWCAVPASLPSPTPTPQSVPPASPTGALRSPTPTLSFRMTATAQPTTTPRQSSRCSSECENGDGCALSPAGSSSWSSMWLLPPAAVLLVRRLRESRKQRPLPAAH